MLRSLLVFEKNRRREESQLRIVMLRYRTVKNYKKEFFAYSAGLCPVTLLKQLEK